MLNRLFGSEANRAYIYRTLMAVGALLSGYGLLSSQELALWLGLAGVILNILPVANTSTRGGN